MSGSSSQAIPPTSPHYCPSGAAVPDTKSAESSDKRVIWSYDGAFMNVCSFIVDQQLRGKGLPMKSSPGSNLKADRETEITSTYAMLEERIIV